MRRFRQTLGHRQYTFDSLKSLLAKASPARSGDALAGIAAESSEERVAAQLCLAEVPLMTFLDETLDPYEEDEVTRLILDSHDPATFAAVSSFTVGDFRNWLLAYDTDAAALAARLQPNDPTDDPRGIAAVILAGLLCGAGDVVIGVNPASDSLQKVCALLAMINDLSCRRAPESSPPVVKQRFPFRLKAEVQTL